MAALTDYMCVLRFNKILMRGMLQMKTIKTNKILLIVHRNFLKIDETF